MGLRPLTRLPHTDPPLVCRRVAAGDYRLMNPAALAETHPNCRKDASGEPLLPNGATKNPPLWVFQSPAAATAAGSCASVPLAVHCASSVHLLRVPM